MVVLENEQLNYSLSLVDRKARAAIPFSDRNQRTSRVVLDFCSSNLLLLWMIDWMIIELEYCTSLSLVAVTTPDQLNLPVYCTTMGAYGMSVS